MPATLKDRVSARLAELDINPFEAARRGELERTFVNDILVGRKRSVRGENLAKLAAALETSTGYLLGENRSAAADSGSDAIRVPGTFRGVVVAGIVEAGAFREADDINDFRREPIPALPDPDFPDARQAAWLVQGDSMNAAKPQPILPGSYVICVDFEDLENRVPLRDGMKVIVERTRDGGLLREWSVKEVELKEDVIVFHPRSTNPRHKPIIVPRNVEADEGVQVTILAIVRYVLNREPL